MRSVNPSTGRLVREYADHDAAEVERRLLMAESAFDGWGQVSFAERASAMNRAAADLRNNKQTYARLMTEEMGKPITESEAEIEKCAWACEYFAENAERFLTPEDVETDASHSFVRYEPLGPVLAIMPWNFPFWQVFRFAAPALMAGNAAVLKHASNVPACALAVEDVFRRAAFPDGVFTTLLVSSGRIEELIRHPAIRAVTLTGSDAAGESVAATAGKALKKTVLELGGSDPFIVLADADVAQSAAAAAKARTINSGQSCIAAKRFIVERKIAESFEAAFTKELQALKVGDPMERDTKVGPLAREDLLETVHSQVERSIAAGARLLTGGKRLEREGFFYPPTALANVKPGMPAFDEETFGPVAALIRAKDAAEAITLANRSQYGLGASIWTADAARGRELAEKIEAGCVFVNEIVKSDPRLPFGGVKRSGYGRELSEAGIREFVNVKSVSVK